MENVGIFYDLLEYFTVIWYILWQFGIFFPFWSVWTEKNLATLVYWSSDLTLYVCTH
jgi:hypothetical protein